jgi:hypothetical protein
MKLHEIILLGEGRKPSASANKFADELQRFIFNQHGKVKRAAEPEKKQKSFNKSPKARTSKDMVKIKSPHQVQFFIDVSDDAFEHLHGKNKKEFVSDLTRFAKSQGWAPAFIAAGAGVMETEFTVDFFPERAEKFRLSADDSSDLYHVTDEQHVSSILKRGLIPMSADAEAPEHEADVGGTFSGLFKNKIFVFKNPGETGEAFFAVFEMLRIDGDMAVLKIDQSKLKKGTKFYVDHTINAEADFPDFVGYWTKTPIPPEAISVVDDLGDED